MPALGYRRFCPRLEQLGDRITPAGNIVTKFSSSGVLTISSTNTGNPALDSQKIALLGASQGHVSISLKDGETITGKNSFNRVTKVICKLGDGDDTVTIVDLKLAKRDNTFQFLGGTGTDSIYFDGQNINIDTVKVSGVVGTLYYYPSNTVRQSFGKIDINCPDALCDILLGGLGVTRTTRVVTGRTKDDFVQIDNATFLGKVTLDLGGGNDGLYMGQIQPNDGKDVTFQSTLVIDLGAGDDLFTAGVKWHGEPDPKPDFVHFNGMVFADAGDGSDTVDVFHPKSTEFTFEGYPVLDNWETIVYAP